MLAETRSIWREVTDRALLNELDKKLPQANPQMIYAKDCVRWVNVAPRSQTVVYLIVSDAGVQLRASSKNWRSLVGIRDSLLMLDDAMMDQIHITPIRLQQSTLSRSFSVKPASLLRNNEVARINLTYKCLELVIDALQPLI